MASTHYQEGSAMTRYTLDEIQTMPTIRQGQYANLKVDTGAKRGHHIDGDEQVWLSRFTVEDDAPYDNQVTVERLVDGCWVTVDEYEAKPESESFPLELAIGGVIRTTHMPHGDKRDLVERIAERLNALHPDFEPGVFATACGLDESEARVVLARCGN